MNKHKYYLLLASSLFATSLSLADGSSSMSQDQSAADQEGISVDQQAGTMGEPGGEQPMKEEQTRKMKQQLSPHTIMMQSSLESAIDHLNGLKTQYQVSQSPSQDVVKQAKMHSKSIRNGIEMAETHQKELRAGIKQFPSVAQSDELRELDTSFKDLKTSNSQWNSRSKNQSYWMDRSRVVADIENLKTHLNSALDKTKSFNSSQLDISFTS